MHKLKEKLTKQFNKIQDLYCELDNEIATLISMITQVSIPVQIEIPDLDKKLKELLKGGSVCVGEEKDDFVVSVDDIRQSNAIRL